MAGTRTVYFGQRCGGPALSTSATNHEIVQEAVGFWLNDEVRYQQGVPAVGPGERKPICFFPQRCPLTIPVAARAHGWQPPTPAVLQAQGVVSFAPLPLHHVDASAFSRFPETYHPLRRSRGISAGAYGVPEVTRRIWGQGHSSPRYKRGTWRSRCTSGSVNVWPRRPSPFALEPPKPAKPTSREVRGMTRCVPPLIRTMATAVSENTGLRYVQAHVGGETPADHSTIPGSQPRKQQN